ncbi:hypothetical protein TRFO_36683 [Tritrichomonas foetus]|uniref:Arf-GAP domain-containing protein n=1 Tax=Tritrichomonas foetus TaxID=1144522 RepID=A0A1J4JIW0_9EUKA|nr:hypothetical protein TRFO_36683 [Tritrichomonas foetus]|eukprot:OHS97156.1 hypothetical protein TRFO_36683 [Tritrichomonas foetus]
MECSGVHRSLGTHISFIRSCHFDSWNDEQVEKMSLVGNIRSNLYFEGNLPEKFRRPSPYDRSALENFIRNKYIKCIYVDEDQPNLSKLPLPVLRNLYLDSLNLYITNQNETNDENDTVYDYGSILNQISHRKMGIENPEKTIGKKEVTDKQDTTTMLQQVLINHDLQVESDFDRFLNGSNRSASTSTNLSVTSMSTENQKDFDNFLKNVDTINEKNGDNDVFQFLNLENHNSNDTNHFNEEFNELPDEKTDNNFNFLENHIENQNINDYKKLDYQFDNHQICKSNEKDIELDTRNINHHSNNPITKTESKGNIIHVPHVKEADSKLDSYGFLALI